MSANIPKNDRMLPQEDMPWLNNPVSAEGVDLTQIRRLLALTPSERVEALTKAANAMLRLKRSVRRV